MINEMEHNSVVKKILSSSIGASVAEIITLPICTVKTVYQSGKESYINVIKNIYNTRGIFGFYKASSPAVACQILTSTCRIGMFNIFNDNYMINTNTDIVISGIATSLTCIILTHPLDYLRVNIQVGKVNSMRWNEIYKGFYPNMCKAFIGGAMFLPLRKILKDRFPDTPSWAIGTAAAAISTIVVHPFDYIKTFLLANSKGIRPQYHNPYRGLGINMCRIIPHFVIMTEVVDYLMIPV